MKTLNLILPEESDIQFQISKFPDGQQDVFIKNPILSKAGSFFQSSDPILIKSRFNNFQDLELIICATQALRELKVKEIHLFIPYLLGARSDRKFQLGGTSYLRDIIAPILNAQGFETVTVYDIHSTVAAAVIKNLVSIDNKSLVEWVIANSSITKHNAVFVAPDNGASHKIYKLAEAIGFKGDIITCSKERDTEGKLTRIEVPIHGDQHHKDLIIIDDICDGGATFINIAKEIRRKQESFKTPPNKIYLIVTHGIFSKGFKELSQYFDQIYCTNSYRVIDYSTSVYLHKEEKGSIIVKQLNIL